MLFEIKNLGFYYQKNNWILRNINLKIESGERVGLVSPSGYGKSTLSRLMAGYLKPVEGEILLNGKPLPQKGYCPVQLIYQHPEKAVDPYWNLEKTLNECWHPDDKFLEKMGIEKEWLKRKPNELSGGELQRFCIARILGPKTKFLIADEISTMLDTITQVQIWEILLKYIEKNNLGCIIITHNKELAKKICTRQIDLEKINKNKVLSV